MEGEDGEGLSPFWVQSSRNRHKGRPFRHGLSSIFLSSGLLITLLLVTAVLFFVFVVPPTISFSSQIFRPNNVKKSWDSLNLVLVLFALVFGFLSRNKNDDQNFDENSYQTTSPNTSNATQKSNPSTPQDWYNYSTTAAENSNPSNHLQWFGYSDQTAYNISNNIRGVGLKRTSSSYSDLLEASSTLTSQADPWVCYDDMRINTTRFSDGQLHHRRSWKYTFDDPQTESKHLYEDKLMNSPTQPAQPSSITSAPATPPSAQPSPPPVSPPLPSASPPLDHEKPMRTHLSVEDKRERRRKRRDQQLERKQPIPEPVKTHSTPPPPPPLPEYVDRKSDKSEKKRSGENATKDFLNSLYHKKEKKQRQKSVENIDALLPKPQTSSLKFQVPPPSPPPPPPPLPVFQNLFSSKKSKRKTTDRVISVPVPLLESAVFLRPKTAHVAPQPVKVLSFDSDEGNSNSGRESPLIPIPPPPPPPPSFVKSTAWKFVLQGDFVRLDSNLSSRSGSPDPDEVESDGTPTAADGGDMPLFLASPLFCPSPDVNAKADNFISKFRAGLKLEKINSINKRGVGLSNLGPGSGPPQN